METLLEIQKLCVLYQTKKTEIEAIKNLDLTVKKGEFIAIIGRSGCGKSSLLSALSGLVPYTGKITFNNIENRKEISVGYMLQKDELFNWLTVEQNVLLPLKIKKIYDKQKADRTIELLNKYGLTAFKKHYPNQLSGGMRQRVALIRTLSFQPELLLLDEPFSALDYQTRLTVCDDVYDIIKKENKTAILVTHDIAEAISCADRVIVLTDRPASVYSENVIDLNKNLPPLSRREQAGFSAWFEKLWKDINA